MNKSEIPIPPLHTLGHGYVSINRLINALVQEQDLKTATRMYKKLKDKRDFSEAMLSSYISMDSFCAIAMFLHRHPEIQFEISDKTLKSVAIYNINCSTDDIVFCKTKDYLHQLFPKYAEKVSLYWIMAFDCIYQNMRPTRKHKLYKQNKYLKSLTLRQCVQLFVQCIQEIEYERTYGNTSSSSNPFAKSSFSNSDSNFVKGKESMDNGSGTGGDTDASTMAFENDIAATSDLLRHKTRIHSLQIFAQRLLLRFSSSSSLKSKVDDKKKTEETNTFWKCIEVYYEKKKQFLDTVLIKAGLPWLVPKEYPIQFHEMIKIETISPFLLPCVANRSFDMKRMKQKYNQFTSTTKPTMYLTYYDKYPESLVVENEELLDCFFGSVRNLKQALLDAANICVPKLVEMCEKSNVSISVSTDEWESWLRDRQAFVFNLLETNLFKILKVIPVFVVDAWTNKTGNVNLHPDFLSKIEFNEKVTTLPEKFYKIQRLSMPLARRA